MSSAEASSATERPSWAVMGCALVAIAALYLQSPKLTAMPVLTLALLAACALNLRLPRGFIATWTVRAALFYVVVVTSGERQVRTSSWFLDPDYINLFGALCAAEMVVQCWQRRRSAPHGEILVLSALILAAASTTFEDQYMRYAAPAYAICLTLALRRFRPRPPGPHIAWREPLTLAKRGLAATAALALGLLSAAALSAYGERVTIYPLAKIFHKRPGEIGLSDAPRLGQATTLRPSNRRVLRVEGLRGEGHLRGIAFDTYIGWQWHPFLTNREFAAVSATELKADAPGHRTRITRLTEEMGLLLAPLDCAGIEPTSAGRIEWDPQHGRVLRTEGEPEAGYTYEVIAAPRPGYQGPLAAPPDQAERDRCLAVPDELDPRVLQLAQQITATGDPKQRIQAVAQHLQSNHSYSLTSRLPDRDPLSDFILQRQSGHCTYFASAAVILLRCVGVPARMVSGYYAHEVAPDGSILVRQRDAHAWAECWVDGTGWVTVDATPASGLPDRAFGEVPLWRRMWEWMQDQLDAARNWVAELDRKDFALGLGIAAAALALVAIARLLIRRRRSAAAVDLRYRFPAIELEAAAAQFEAMLRRNAVPCESNRTWREHLARIAAGHPRRIDVEAATAFIREYNGARFGQRRGEARLQHLRDLLERLERPAPVAVQEPENS